MNYILKCGEASELMAKELEDNSIDLTVTSPPYDNLRKYLGYTFPFESIAQQLYRVTKRGGVVVWVVGDATIKGSETGTSFRQTLHFMSLGFNLYDTMFYEKASRIPTEGRYYSVVEYMFVFSKGKPKTIHYLCDHKNSTEGQRRTRDLVINKGNNIKKHGQYMVTPAYSRRSNLWRYGTGMPTDLRRLLGKYGIKHPAIIPEKLVLDHILSWSNPDDVVFDPMMGSGTTGKMALLNGRRFIGYDISQEYVDLARERIELALAKQ